MTNLERLKMMLNNKEYFTDTEFEVFLSENGLVVTDTYIKVDNEINLLETTVAILESLSNDVDMMRKISSDEIGLTTEEAFKYLATRIKNLNEKILTLKEMQESQEEYTNIRPIFFNGIITK